MSALIRIFHDKRRIKPESDAVTGRKVLFYKGLIE